MGRIWTSGGGGGADLDAVTAGAWNVEAGKVIVGPDGEPLTGTLRNITSDSTIDHASNNTTPVVLGDQAFVSQNSDGVTRAEIRFNGTRGVLEPNTLIAIPQSNMASAGGLTAAKLLAGQSAFGLSGTATSDATATAAHIRQGYTAYVKGQKITGTMAAPPLNVTYLNKIIYDQVVSFADTSNKTFDFSLSNLGINYPSLLFLFRLSDNGGEFTPKYVYALVHNSNGSRIECSATFQNFETESYNDYVNIIKHSGNDTLKLAFFMKYSHNTSISYMKNKKITITALYGFDKDFMPPLS